MGSIGSCAEIIWRQNLIKSSHTDKINYRENLFSFQALCPARRHEGSKGLALFSQRKQIPLCALTREGLSWLPKLWVHCLSNFALIFSTLVQMLFVLLEIVCIYIPLWIWKTAEDKGVLNSGHLNFKWDHLPGCQSSLRLASKMHQSPSRSIKCS